MVPLTLNSKPTPGGRELYVTQVALHWACNPVQTVSASIVFNPSDIILTSGPSGILVYMRLYAFIVVCYVLFCFVLFCFVLYF